MEIKKKRTVTQLGDIKKDMDTVVRQVSEIHSAIAGNPSLGHVGLAGRVVQAEADIKDLNKDRMKLIGAFAVITGLAVFLGPAAGELAKRLLTLL